MTALSQLRLRPWQDFDKTEMSLRPRRGLSPPSGEGVVGTVFEAPAISRSTTIDERASPQMRRCLPSSQTSPSRVTAVFGTRRRLPIESRTPRQKAARTAAQTDRRLDQPANPKATNPSLNSNAGCLKVVDTFRSPAEIDAARPTTATRSRRPRAFTLRTAKPFSSLLKRHPLDGADERFTGRSVKRGGLQRPHRCGSNRPTIPKFGLPARRRQFRLRCKVRARSNVTSLCSRISNAHTKEKPETLMLSR